MSGKINLSKAKIGDEFRYRNGMAVMYVGMIKTDVPYKYWVFTGNGFEHSHTADGSYYSYGQESSFDIVAKLDD